jgi:hypothetical protein
MERLYRIQFGRSVRTLQDTAKLGLSSQSLTALSLRPTFPGDRQAMTGAHWPSTCRFTRLTNAFSKKVKNHSAAIALYFMYYNFGRVHQTLRVTQRWKVASRITHGASSKAVQRLRHYQWELYT